MDKIFAPAQTNRNRANQATPHLELGLTKNLQKTSSNQKTEILMKEKLWLLRNKKNIPVACWMRLAHYLKLKDLTHLLVLIIPLSNIKSFDCSSLLFCKGSLQNGEFWTFRPHFEELNPQRKLSKAHFKYKENELLSSIKNGLNGLNGDQCKQFVLKLISLNILLLPNTYGPKTSGEII